MKPCHREVIWVIGEKGNEWKSRFQEFLESKFGWESRLWYGYQNEEIKHLSYSKEEISLDT